MYDLRNKHSTFGVGTLPADALLIFSVIKPEDIDLLVRGEEVSQSALHLRRRRQMNEPGRRVKIAELQRLRQRIGQCGRDRDEFVNVVEWRTGGVAHGGRPSSGAERGNSA